MSDLETKLAEAREGIMPNDVSEMAASHRRAFDAAAAIAREVVAKKDDEIAQALDDLARWESIARDSIKYGLEKDAEIARLEAALENEKWETAGVNLDIEFACAKERAMSEKPRKVTDAQREAMVDTLLENDVDNKKWARKMVEEFCQIIESTDEPAAK
jgi:hypothetical protein